MRYQIPPGVRAETLLGRPVLTTPQGGFIAVDDELLRVWQEAGEGSETQDEVSRAALANGAVCFPRCRTCRQWTAYPRPFCPHCLGELELQPVAGTATVYSATVVHRATSAFASSVPYVHAVVELHEGIRVATLILTDDPSSISIGDRVSAVIDHDDGAHTPPGAPRLLFGTTRGT